jgi:hypothetical protein
MVYISYHRRIICLIDATFSFSAGLSETFNSTTRLHSSISDENTKYFGAGDNLSAFREGVWHV